MGGKWVNLYGTEAGSFEVHRIISDVEDATGEVRVEAGASISGGLRLLPDGNHAGNLFPPRRRG